MASCEYDKCSLSKKGTEPSENVSIGMRVVRSVYGPNARPSYDHRVNCTLHVTNKANETYRNALNQV